MAQDVEIRGVEYDDVPAVRIPNVNGTASYFYDTSGATLDSGDKLLAGNTAWAGGVLYTGTIVTKTGTDLSASGDTVTVPAGYYALNATKAVAAGSASGPASVTGTGATISTGTNTLTLSKIVSTFPQVTAGYVASGTAASSSVSLTANVTTKAAATITPTTSAQTIASGTYLTGAQTVAGDPALVGSNIVAGASIFNVQGTAVVPVISQDSQTKILSIS